MYWEKKNETANSGDSDCSNMGTWDYCWFWLLKVNAWGKMIDLHFSKTQDKQVKPKINTTYCVIIALRSCFMWYSKPFKKTVIKSLSKLCYLRALKPAVSKEEWLVLLWGIPNEGTSTNTLLLFSSVWRGLELEIGFNELVWKKREWTELILQVK